VRTIYSWVAGIALASGIGVVLAGPSPTGSTPIDVVLIVAAVSFSVVVVASAPWTRKWPGSWRPVIVAAVLGVALQVLARLGNIWHFGVSSAIALLPIFLLTLLATQWRDERQALRLWAVGGGLLAAAVLALVGFGVAAASARPDFTKGSDEARLAMQHLKAGDFDSAQQGFRLAADLLGGATKDLDRLWAQPVRFVPVAAQHRNAAARLAESAQSASNTISDVLGDIDFDRLRLVNGTIDVGAITALQQPLASLNDALDDLHNTVHSVDSPWLVAPVQSRIDDLNHDITDQQVQSQRATLAVERAPAMLGANGKRVYFIAFTTPAEARGLGGFMGNWAEVTMDAGHISVTGFGRTADLAVNGDAEQWARITSSPHFPEVAQAIADGYPAFSGHAVDGVIAMDVYAVGALMTMTGPIDLTSLAQTVGADSVAKFLLSDQYSLTQTGAVGIDMLEEVAGSTINRLLTTELPKPPDLITVLAPFVAQGRLDAWAVHAEDETLFERMGMAGELTAPVTGDALAVVINNVGNNKIDYFASGDQTYKVTTDSLSETATATLDITLRNGAPAGLVDPAIVFGDSQGAAPGTSVMQVNLQSVLPIVKIKVDGVDRVADATSTSQGFLVSRLDLQIPPQGTVSIHVDLAGRLDLDDGYHLMLRNQAAVHPLTTTIVIDGQAQDDASLDLSGMHHIDT
jgi:hypothetical protein